MTDPFALPKRSVTHEPPDVRLGTACRRQGKAWYDRDTEPPTANEPNQGLHRRRSDHAARTNSLRTGTARLKEILDPRDANASRRHREPSWHL